MSLTISTEQQYRGHSLISHQEKKEETYYEVKVKSHYLNTKQDFDEFRYTVLKSEYHKLDLSNCPEMTDDHFLAIFWVFKSRHYDSLKKCDLSKNPQLGIQAGSAFLTALSFTPCPSLLVLDVSSLKGETSLWMVRALGFKACPNLKKLRAQNCDFKPSEANEVITNIAKGCLKLELLDLSHTKLTDLFVKQVCLLVKGGWKPNLTEFRFDGSSLSDRAFSKLQTALKLTV
jgi:hypothetical protein